jgi:hypothetical protein
MNSTQYGSPILLSEDQNQSFELERINLVKSSTFEYSEDWLQQKLDEYPGLLPVTEIDPIFGELIPVCRELRTAVGPLDNLYVNERGMLTLVECKLWRNPEARRQVVGQILDYAQEFSRMDYEDLTARINTKTGRTGNSLHDIVSEKTEGIDEKEFVDSVTSNLKRGRFLLLIVGDGIHENVENISSYLQEHAQLNFTFALVEQNLYKLDHGGHRGILIQPRIIAKTVEIERAVVRIEGDTSNLNVTVESSGKKPDGQKSRVRGETITEQVFYEGIDSRFPGISNRVKELIESLTQKDLVLDAGSSAMMIKSRNTQFNFLAFKPDGSIRNYGCGSSELGREYMEKLAELFDDAIIYEASNGFHSTIKNADDTYMNVKNILGKKEQWIQLIEWVLSQEQENQD